MLRLGIFLLLFFYTNPIQSAAQSELSEQIWDAALFGNDAQLEELFTQHGTAACTEQWVNNWNGRTPLHLAAEYDNVACLKVLLKHNIPVDDKGRCDATALLIAAYKGHIMSVKLLLEHQANPLAKNIFGMTPLHAAASKGYVECLKILLQHNAYANINATDGSQSTLLHDAAFFGHIDCVRLLLQCGANRSALSSLTWEGQTPEQAAKANKHPDIAEFIRTYDVTEEEYQETWQLMRDIDL